MNKDYKDRVTPRGKKTAIYSGLLWFLSGTALGGLLIGAGVLWLNLGPTQLEEVPILTKTKTETNKPKPDVGVVEPAKPETSPIAAPKLEFEYDKILRDAQVTLPDPNQDDKIKVTQPPPPKEPVVAPVATIEQPDVVTDTLPVAEDTSATVATKRSTPAKKTKTNLTSTVKPTTKKLAVKSTSKTTTSTTPKTTTSSKKIASTTPKTTTSSKKTTPKDNKTTRAAKSKTRIVESQSKPVTTTRVVKTNTKPSTSTTTASKKKSSVVQLGAFQNEEDLKKLRARMALIGVETTVEKVTTKGKTIQRLRTTPYKDQSELNEAKKLFTKHNIKTFVVQ